MEVFDIITPVFD